MLFFLLCCSHENSKVTNEVKPKAEKSKYGHLIDKFETIDIDTFHVYSTYDYDGFKGIELEFDDVELFPKEILSENFPENEIEIYACYRFNIDSSKIGLIARTPSMYAPTSIKLFIYDKKVDSIISFIEVSETWGDAGESLEKESWIFLKKNKLKILTKKVERSDHSAYAEDENDTIVEIWKSYHLINFSNSVFDTISDDEKYLKQIYHSLIETATNTK